MEYIKWSNSYSVGVEEIDSQHKRLFEMINEFRESLEKEDLSAPKKLLISLLEYALDHFGTEEKYFDMYHYSDSERHKEEHKTFEMKVMDFQSAYQSKGTFNVVVISDFLKKWIINHVLIFDRKYMECFIKNGLQ